MRKLLGSLAIAGSLIGGDIAITSVSTASAGVPAPTVARTVIAPASSATVANTAKQTVYYYGDSLAHEAAGPFIVAVENSGEATVIRRTFPGTAPCDWEHDVRKAADAHPAAVVLAFSGNDVTPCMTRRLGARPSAAQVADTYLHDLNVIVGMLGTGPRIIVSSAPEARNYPTVINGGPEIDNAMRTVAAEDPNVVYVDAGRAIETPSGTFTQTMTCRPEETAADGCHDGQIRVRAKDGLHFCPTESGPSMSGNCDVYSSGANRYGLAMARALIAGL